LVICLGQALYSIETLGCQSSSVTLKCCHTEVRRVVDVYSFHFHDQILLYLNSKGF